VAIAGEGGRHVLPISERDRFAVLMTRGSARQRTELAARRRQAFTGSAQAALSEGLGDATAFGQVRLRALQIPRRSQAHWPAANASRCWADASSRRMKLSRACDRSPRVARLWVRVLLETALFEGISQTHVPGVQRKGAPRVGQARVMPLAGEATASSPQLNKKSRAVAGRAVATVLRPQFRMDQCQCVERSVIEINASTPNCVDGT
jgi:hypothetical protein